MEQTPFSSALNPTQLEAVTYCDGPMLVIAGAGSGKTRVLTYKIAYLLQCGYEPWNILALTFTNKAAREMNERIANLCAGASIEGLWSGTFHSIFARILRMEHTHIDFPQNYTIYDSSDTRSLLKQIVKEMGLDEKAYKIPMLAGKISEAKNHLILPGEYEKDGSIIKRDHADGTPRTADIYKIYQQRLKASAAMDFDDLLLYTYLLLRNNEEVRNRYKARFRYILVDEYQDTNQAQHRILTLLTNPDSCICVVGDDAQSIYGFRGADIRNILTFQEQYPKAKLVKLECNYRSTRCIVEAANSIISNNIRQIPKTIYAAGDQGDLIKVLETETDKQEAQTVARHISLLRQKGTDFSEIALLYRTNAQSRSFEEVFQKNDIPYRIYGGLSFYQRKEIKDVLGYCRYITNTSDEEAFRRIINSPKRGIGDTTQQKILMTADNARVSAWQVIENPEKYGLTISGTTAKRINEFYETICQLRQLADTHTASDVVTEIVKKSGIAAELLADRSVEAESRRENIEEFIGSVRSYEHDQAEEGINHTHLADFLATVSLLTDADQREDGTPRVTLMTIHAAKGLEFEAVFVTGMEEELFPTASAMLYPREMEEERRLFYVAVTRAKRYCFLSYARMRFRFGNMIYSEPSPFIDEIDAQYLQRPQKLRSENYSGRNSSFKSNSNWGGTNTSRHFDDFFGNTSEDDFRKGGYSAESSRYSDNSNRYYKNSEREEYIPRRVAPPAPPEGFKRAGRSPKIQSPSASTNSQASLSGVSIGTRINHERFGEGTVVGMEGQGDSTKIRVDFDQVGAKNLLVKFAKFTIIH